MLRIAKHGIQTIAVMTVVAKMKGLQGGDLDLLPHVETESVQDFIEAEPNQQAV